MLGGESSFGPFRYDGFLAWCKLDGGLVNKHPQTEDFRLVAENSVRWLSGGVKTGWWRRYGSFLALDGGLVKLDGGLVKKHPHTGRLLFGGEKIRYGGFLAG